MLTLEPVERASPLPERTYLAADPVFEARLEREAGACRLPLVSGRFVDDVRHLAALASGVAEDPAVAPADRLGVEIGDDGPAARPKDARELSVERREAGEVPGGEPAPDDAEVPRGIGERAEIRRSGAAGSPRVAPPLVEHLEDEVGAEGASRPVAVVEDETAGGPAGCVEERRPGERRGEERHGERVERRERVLLVVRGGPEAISLACRKRENPRRAQRDGLRCP